MALYKINEQYSYRIDPPNDSTVYPHIHIQGPDGKEWKQRADGSPYEPNHKNTKAGDPPRKIRELLKKAKDDNDNNKKGGGGAAGPGWDWDGNKAQYEQSKNGKTNQIDVQEAEVIVEVGIGIGVGYVIYRGIRLIPSLFPPMWPTLVPNLVTP